MKGQISKFLEHAKDALSDAHHLQQNGRVMAVTNRTYYAVFYCLCALLTSEGALPEKHQAIRARFSELFVGNGRFDVQASKIVGNTISAHHVAEYDVDAFISEVETQLLLDDAKIFYDLTLAYFA